MGIRLLGFVTILTLICCSAGYCQIATPTFSPDGGTYSGSVTVTMSCSTPGASIIYTTDGTDPMPFSSQTYSSPITLTTTTVLKAKGWIMGLGISSVKSATYTVSAVVADPVVTPDSGTYSTPQTVSMSCATSGATIRYTTNGTDPTESSTAYTSPLTLYQNTTVKAKAWKSGLSASSVVSKSYTISCIVATPSISPVGGTYSSAQTITLSCSTSGAAIRYTTDGTTPTSGSTLYTASFQVTNDTVVKAKAFLTNWTDSAVASETYTINYTIFVNASNTSGTYDGLSWATAYRTIAGAMTAAYAGDNIWVAGGTYNERITVKDGVGLYGGFSGTETSLEARDYRVNVSTINGSSGGVVITVPQNAEDTTIIDGFKVQGGSSTTGGGVLVNQNAEAIVRNCYIASNSATSGAAIYSDTAMPSIVGNVIVSNTATNGSAIYLKSSPAVIVNNTIVSNTATTNGAIYIDSASAPVVANNIIQGNSSGVFNASGSPTLRNNCVYGNTGYNYSGLSAGANDISQNALFIDGASGNYHLNVGSPCINTGSDADMQTNTDWDKQPRKSGSAVDIGVDEYYRVDSPIISPNGGTYDAPKPVELTCSTAGASIRYTLDGSDPTISSAEYSEWLSLESSCTLKARAFKVDYLPSEIVSAAFTIIDTAAPYPGILDAPEYANTTPITVSYSGARDIGDNGLKRVELWYKYGIFGTWAYTNMSRTTSSGSFTFTPTGGVGVYYFQLVAEDNGSLRSPSASGEGQDSTIYLYNIDACSLPAVIIPPMP